MADDIGRWLEDLGLGKYVDVFAENEIDSIVLPDLSEADFEKIGIPGKAGFYMAPSGLRLT